MYKKKEKGCNKDRSYPKYNFKKVTMKNKVINFFLQISKENIFLPVQSNF